METTSALPGEYIPTVFDNYTKNVLLDGYPAVNLEYIDTDPGEEHKKLRQLSYRQTDVFLFCFSLVHPSSLDKIESYWIPEIKDFFSNQPYILVGTNADMRDNFGNIDINNENGPMEPIPTRIGEKFAQKIHAFKYFEVSFQSLENVDEISEAVVMACYKDKIVPEEQKTEGGCCNIF